MEQNQKNAFLRTKIKPCLDALAMMVGHLLWLVCPLVGY